MELPGNSGHLIILSALSFRIGLLLSLSVAVAVTDTCQDEQKYLTDDKICCNKCSPGFKFVGHCHGPDLTANCTPCPSEEFMDKFNYHRNCFRCAQCKLSKFEIEVSACQPAKDRVCQCKNGFYKFNIDKATYECRTCSTCKDNEREVMKCTPESNTRCDCKEGYYKVKNKCLPCTNCTPDCPVLCPPINPIKVLSDPSSFLINIIAGVVVAVVVTLVLVVVVTHFVTKHQTKRKLLSSSHFKETSKIYQEVTVHCEEPLNHCVQTHSEPLRNVLTQEPSNLPDCVPPEIKISEVIYSLLELVPVLQVKQLVRFLGVSDTVIERAELDHRSSKEAHYQMLRAWAENSSHICRGGHGGVLHLPQMQELLGKLRLIHLEQTAQELETKYNLL